MVDLVCIRQRNALIPATAFDLDQLEKVRRGEPLATTVVFRRSARHNRWYRALVGVVADGLGMPPGLLHADIKFKAGLVANVLMSKKAGPIVELESCAFATMDEARFTEFTNLAVEIIFRDYLPEVSRKDVFAQVESMVGKRPR